MTSKQLSNTLNTKRLSLDKKSIYKHFEGSIWACLICIFLLGYFVYRILMDDVILTAPMLFLLIFPIMTVAIWLNQYLILKCKQIDTNFNAERAYVIAKLTLETLQWPINKEVTNQYFQAINPFGDIRTWGDEMITVIVTDKKVLVNSICNLEYGLMAQSCLSFGKNKQNLRKFIDSFNLLSQYPEK